MTGRCSALDTPNTQYYFCPNLGAAYLFTILFGVTTVAHFAQAILYRKVYCWVIAMSRNAQTLACIFRILSIKYPATYSSSSGKYTIWFVLILIAPLFTNAFAHMVMGRMSTFDSDMGSFVSSASSDDASTKEILQGLHIYMVGVGMQQFSIFVFLLFAFKFHQTLRDQCRRNIHTSRQAWVLLYALYVVIILITIRIIFRLIENSQGLTSSIPNHEAFQYIFDSVPMFFALVLLNIFHPGRIMAGLESNIPGRKERKNKVFTTRMQRFGGSESE
ncbi:hypothetical protein SBOR_7436 [Sclerotinia borealis F-4128]|uniref:RTA1 domain protein n=1 Tax=Sclerotinia borealis (strain F-4128) TaxID=1432307 RepID=W9CBE5_SCLBF|nr:hypothetical protein SBOR_7436 [Sclerotinia borealis F-4128]